MLAKFLKDCNFFIYFSPTNLEKIRLKSHIKNLECTPHLSHQLQNKHENGFPLVSYTAINAM